LEIYAKNQNIVKIYQLKIYITKYQKISLSFPILFC